MTTIRHIAERSLPRKRTVSTRKSVTSPSTLAGCRGLIALVWRAAVDLVAPMGYEDARGFCYGNEPGMNVPKSRRETQF